MGTEVVYEKAVSHLRQEGWGECLLQVKCLLDSGCGEVVRIAGCEMISVAGALNDKITDPRLSQSGTRSECLVHVIGVFEGSRFKGCHVAARVVQRPAASQVLYANAPLIYPVPSNLIQSTHQSRLPQ